MREPFSFVVMNLGMRLESPVRQKPRITKPNAEGPHQWAKAQSKVQFSVMQWAAMSTEPVMGPEFVWEAETTEERNAVDEKSISTSRGPPRR